MLDRDDRREVRGFAWYGLRWLIAIIVLSSVLSGLGWATGVLFAPVKGKGEAYKTKESSTNRIAAQERFEDMYADIQAADLRIDTLTANAKAHPKDYTAQVQATGAVTYCQQVVNQYNAEARKYTAAQFRAADLPSSIDAASTCSQEA